MKPKIAIVLLFCLTSGILICGCTSLGNPGVLSLGQTAHFSANKDVTVVDGHCAETSTKAASGVYPTLIFQGKNVRFYITVKNTQESDGKIWQNSINPSNNGNLFLSDAEGDTQDLGFMPDHMKNSIEPGQSTAIEYTYTFSDDSKNQEFLSRLQKHAELKIEDASYDMSGKKTIKNTATWDVTSVFQICSGTNNIEW